MICMTERAESCAAMSSGGESAEWRSTRWSRPGRVAGMASRELSQLGESEHRPSGLAAVSKMCSWVGLLVKVNTFGVVRHTFMICETNLVDMKRLELYEMGSWIQSDTETEQKSV